jgi:hypothetical protein
VAPRRDMLSEDDDYQSGPEEASDVDWERYRVVSRAGDNMGGSDKPQGPPTPWGAEYRAILPVSNLAQEVKSAQITRMQCSDNYSRAWQLAGSLEVNTLDWAVDSPDWDAFLEITFGVGQAVAIHRLDLRALCQLALDSTVYVPIDVGGGRESRPWVIGGGIFAQQIATRVIVQGSSYWETPFNAYVTVMGAPFNAGTGL